MANPSGKAARKIHMRAMMDAAKDGGCTTCSEHDPTVMEFNHVERHGSPSWRTLGRMTNTGASIIDFLGEMNKCVVMCANCHRRYTGEVLCLVPWAPRASERVPQHLLPEVVPGKERVGYLYSTWRADSLVHRAVRSADGVLHKACQRADRIALDHTVLLDEVPPGRRYCDACSRYRGSWGGGRSARDAA